MTMGSYRAILIGPPGPLTELVGDVCSYIDERDVIKNTTEYEEFTLSDAREVYQYEQFHESYPYLFQFPRRKLLSYLDDLERKGYEKIAGQGIWFIAYHRSPGTVIENRRREIIQYTIEDGSGGTVTPFSYDPAQDFKTEP
jgi:hypothetical protein